MAEEIKTKAKELEEILSSDSFSPLVTIKRLEKLEREIWNLRAKSEEEDREYLRNLLRLIEKNIQINHAKEALENGKLLAMDADGNWNYFLVTRMEKRQRSLCPSDTVEVPVNNVYSIPKISAAGEGCVSSSFGDLAYFRDFARKSTYLSLTELGEKVVFNNYVPVE